LRALGSIHYKSIMARNERSAGFIAYSLPGGAGGPPEYLLLDYSRHWDFPKGHVNPGEDDLAAALRELQEETGIAGSRVRVVPAFRHDITYFFRDRRKGLVRKTVVFFLAEVGTREVTLSHEHVAFEFLPFEEAVRRVTYAKAKQVLRLAHAHLTAVSAAGHENRTE
jgi:8-oxo-dGTP pyrophosphatase MutT (NUDIX family)